MEELNVKVKGIFVLLDLLDFVIYRGKLSFNSPRMSDNKTVKKGISYPVIVL